MVGILDGALPPAVVVRQALRCGDLTLADLLRMAAALPGPVLDENIDHLVDLVRRLEADELNRLVALLTDATSRVTHAALVFEGQV